MDNFLATRSQRGMSLAFHIVFAAIGVSLPLMMTIAEWRWRSTGDPAYLLLAKRWANETTILFAGGAISGTRLSFALRLLWPRFMQYAGPVIGMPFSLEGFAFFTEAIFVTSVNGWMNTPTGFDIVDGKFRDIHPFTAMLNPAGIPEAGPSCFLRSPFFIASSRHIANPSLLTLHLFRFTRGGI
jgi:cytochrome d ubiquinol oxidase subunit I